MLMEKRETGLSQQAERLVAAIQARGPGWNGRAEIAAYLGKPRLVASDASALDLLIMQGRIEAERHEIDAPIRERWEYRAKVTTITYRDLSPEQRRAIVS